MHNSTEKFLHLTDKHKDVVCLFGVDVLLHVCPCISERFYHMKQCPDTYFTTVIENVEKSQIVGAATLVIEQKFIHSAALVSFLFTVWLVG